MTKTVCVLTNFRAGSTSFTLQKAVEYDLPYKGELFSHERPWPYAGIEAYHQEMKIRLNHKDDPRIPERDARTTNGFDFTSTYIKGLQDREPICFKLMPDHTTPNWRKPLPNTHDIDIVKSCEKVYLLYRRDWYAQAMSWVALRANGKFGENGFAHPLRNGSQTTFDFHWKMHVGKEYGEKTVEKKVKGDMHGHFVHMCLEQLMNNYKRLAEIYHEVPGIELVCMEDFFATTDYKKYNHEFIWEDGMPDIPEFDTEGLFK